jgi:peptidoglycan hydrolase CwlO-like protein
MDLKHTKELNDASMTFAKVLAETASFFLKDELEGLLGKIFQQHLEPFAKQLGELKEDVGQIKTEVNQLKAEVRDVKAEVNELKEEVKDVKAEVNQLNERFDRFIDFQLKGLRQLKKPSPPPSPSPSSSLSPSRS